MNNEPTTTSTPDGLPLADEIDLVIPLTHRLASTVRVVAASLGADAGLDVDEIDDLRLAVDEAVSVIIDHNGNDSAQALHADRLQLRFEVVAGTVTVTVTTLNAPRPIAVDDVDELARRILAAVVDRFDVTDGALVLVKHASTNGG